MGIPTTPVRCAAGATDGVNKTLLYRETEASRSLLLPTTNFREAVIWAGPDKSCRMYGPSRD